MNLGVDLVTHKTSLRNQVGLDSLVDTGSGDSNVSRDSMNNSNWSCMGNSNRGSMGNSNWGSMGNSNRGSSNSGNGSSKGNRGDIRSSSYSRSSSIGQAMSTEETLSSDETISSEDTVSGKDTSVANNLGISISYRGGHGGTEEGRKNNKEVHGAENRVETTIPM